MPSNYSCKCPDCNAWFSAHTMKDAAAARAAHMSDTHRSTSGMPVSGVYRDCLVWVFVMLSGLGGAAWWTVDTLL